MKRVIGILLAGVLSLGLLAGCGKAKMTAAEAKFREECETFTYEQLVKLDTEELQKVLVSGTIQEHKTDPEGKPYLIIETEEKKEMKIRNDTIDLKNFKDGDKIDIWGSVFGLDVSSTNELIPAIKAKYIEKVK